MNPEHLVKMANQIGSFFETWPNRAAARQEVVNHLRRFWEPRMRQALVAHLAATGQASGLHELVAQAVVELADTTRV